MGQHELGGTVANGVDAVNVGAHKVVDLDGATLGELHAGLLQAVALNPRSESDGLQNAVGFNDLGLPTLRRRDGDLDLVTGVVDGIDLSGSQHLNAEFLVGLSQLGRDLLVLVRDHTIEKFNDGHVTAVISQHIGELSTDGSRTGDDDGSRDGVGKDLFLVGDDPTGELGAWQSLDDRTDCDDRVVESDLVGHLAVRVFNRDGLGAGELPPAVELGDFVLLHEEVDALDHAGRHFAGTTEGFAEVDGDVPANTEGLGLLGDDVG